MAMKYFKEAQTQSINSLGIDGINAYFQDTISSEN